MADRKSRHKISQYKKITTVKMYILGPGDGIQIELLNIPELSGKFDIGPDGTVYLPRLRSLYVEGLTLEELRSSNQKIPNIRTFLIFLRQTTYRPIRIYVTGEVRRPGFTLSQITYRR